MSTEKVEEPQGVDAQDVEMVDGLEVVGYEVIEVEEITEGNEVSRYKLYKAD